MPDTTYYALDANNNLIETLSKEEILDAIAQAQQGGSVLDYSNAFVTKIREINANDDLQFWIGTQAEYNALAVKENNVLYIISDDNHKEEIIEAIENIAAGLTNETAAREAADNALDSRLDELEAKDLDSRLDELEGQNLDSRLSAVEDKEEILENRIDTHRSNSNVHLSANEKAYLHSPFIVGSYFGTGTNEREFDINNVQNELAAVIVFTSGQGVIGYTGIAIAGGFSSLGVEITANGFKVYNGVSGYYLNREDEDYGYIAFKKYMS